MASPELARPSLFHFPEKVLGAFWMGWAFRKSLPLALSFTPGRWGWCPHCGGHRRVMEYSPL